TTYIKITVNKDGKATKIIMAEDKFQDTSKVNATYRVKTITDDYIRVMEGGESVEYSIGSKSDVAFYVWDNKNNRFDEVDFDDAEEFCDTDHTDGEGKSVDVYARIGFRDGKKVSSVYLALENEKEKAFGEAEATER